MSEFEVGEPVASVDDYSKLVSWLPKMLEQLLTCKPYNAENRPPRGEHGLYLFSEKDRHFYVGRTGITARARAGATRVGNKLSGPV